MNTTLVKISDNEYRVDDKFTLNYRDGVSVDVDYSKSFKEDKDKYWYEIKLKFHGIKEITVWNKHNTIDLGIYDNPCDNFIIDDNYHGKFNIHWLQANFTSENSKVNLLLALYRIGAFDYILKGLTTMGNRSYLSRDEVWNEFKETGLIPMEIMSYGFSNKVIAYFDSDLIDIKTLTDRLKYEPFNIQSNPLYKIRRILNKKRKLIVQ